MLNDARRMRADGADVVVGFVETHGRARTNEQIADLEVIPPREIPYRGVVLHEMDAEAVIARRPDITLVDELAHTNAPGSKHAKRYQDVYEILDAGIDVNSTMNIQHLESLNDYVKQITGIEVHETVPDGVLDDADDVEVVDMAPEALIRRMVHGNVYPPEQARRALENFFTLGNLQALRDLALRATAKEVEDRLAGFMAGKEGAADTSDEKVMVALDHRQNGRALVRRGCRMATALRCPLIVVHVDPVHAHRQAKSLDEERQLRSGLQLAHELDADVVRLRGGVADELIQYARSQNVTHLLLGHPVHGKWTEFLRSSVMRSVLQALPDVDVHVIADASQAS
jgi:two-component system sensor histidine kinase KdpD